VSGPILLLGGSGRLGSALRAEMERRQQAYVAPPRNGSGLAADASAVIHAGGFTNVDAAELEANHDDVQRANVEGPRDMAVLCAGRKTPFVYLSTDYVFDGGKGEPYDEDDEAYPLQNYGASKLAGEREILSANPAALIVRVSTLYGLPERPAYVDKILAAARQGADLAVVEHPVSSPTYVADVAPALLDLLDRKATGIVHVVNDGAASRLELARAVVALAGLGDRVHVTARPEAPGSLARPPYSVLDTAKLESLLGRRLPPWKDALARYLATLRDAA